MNFTDINLDTKIYKGMQVMSIQTNDHFTIGRLIKDKFEMLPYGKRTDIAHGVIFVAGIDELSKNYRLVEQD